MKTAYLALIVAASMLTITGCSKKPNTDSGVPEAAVIPKNANEVPVLKQKYGKTEFFAVEGTFSESSFSRLQASVASKPESERNAFVRSETQKIFEQLRGVHAIAFTQSEQVGYFSFLLPYNANDRMGALKTLKFNHNIVLNPVVMDNESLNRIKSLTPAAEGLLPRASGSRRDYNSFSGLQRIRAPEFVRLAESEIGGMARVNGDSVKLGITDTGITYNHPTFLSRDGKKNRIIYMKDFTREGRVYFNPAAAFAAKPVAGGADTDLELTAQVIANSKLPSLPAGNDFTEVKGLVVKVSPELKAILLDPASGAKLGVLQEDVLQGDGESVDINGNGKVDDELPMIFVPGKAPGGDVVYFDASGTGDFRDAKPMGDWNTSKAMIDLFAERAGFNIQDDKLPSADGSGEVAVKSASIVGYDPGNHGSHVAGIAAGNKTIANDADDTLARGVAPEAQILMNRVCSNNGGCNETQAVIDLVIKGGAQVVNMSLGGLNPFNDGYSVAETIFNRLVSIKSAQMIISAGNSGPGKQTVGSPSTARLSISVGAAASVGIIQRQYQWPASSQIDSVENDIDFMLFFSSRGPTAAGGFKPNLAAPGTELSAVKLNSVPGERGGMDVYWGTSMAAPTATGAYALLLDAVQKYNLSHPEKMLASDAMTLRRVLIESARPFDVATYNPDTGAKTSGQYTWVDEGTGMLDLVAAWKKLAELRDSATPSAVTLGDAPVELDYRLVIPMKNPRSQAYDGTRVNNIEPIFGTGVYLDYAATETLLPVYISRKLPEALAAGPDAGMLTRQLLTTKDEFVLKTVFYGSDQAWLKAGVLDQLNCSGSDTANLVLLGSGVEINANEDNTGSVVPLNASVLNLCVDRQMVRNQLQPGDHGVLISAYRTSGGRVSPVPSFVVPVYLQVPHKTLAASTAYEFQSTIKSFGVSRNYVTVPKGTSLLQISLEVPPIKTDANGLVAPGEDCSGVELMALQGNNTQGLYKTRKEARIANCDANGRPVTNAAKRTLRFTKTDPNPGTWDVHVFDQYKYASSKFKIRVDYLTATSETKKIEGDLKALTGSLTWKVAESSLPISPDSGKSTLAIDSLTATSQATVAKGAFVIVASPLGEMRSYPAGVKSVTITTGGSTGNDLDLLVMECNAGAPNADDPSCEKLVASGGPTDEETVTFVPKLGKLYAARVDGYEVKNDGAFQSTESLAFAAEKGTVTITGSGSPDYTVQYTMSDAQLAQSKLANHTLFTSGKYGIGGALTLRTAEDTVLFAIPVSIRK